jgi:hypothetical protein
MGLWHLLDERPLEPSDVEVIKDLAEGVIGRDSVLVQALVRPGDRFVGSVRVIDLETQRDDRDDRAGRIRAVLREAGYEAHARPPARSVWSDVEVQHLSPTEWKRRRGSGGGIAPR